MVIINYDHERTERFLLSIMRRIENKIFVVNYEQERKDDLHKQSPPAPIVNAGQRLSRDPVSFS